MQKYHLKKIKFLLKKKIGAIAIGEEENYMKNISPPKYRGYYHTVVGEEENPHLINGLYRPATNLIIQLPIS